MCHEETKIIQLRLFMGWIQSNLSNFVTVQPGHCKIRIEYAAGRFSGIGSLGARETSRGSSHKPKSPERGVSSVWGEPIAGVSSILRKLAVQNKFVRRGPTLSGVGWGGVGGGGIKDTTTYLMNITVKKLLALILELTQKYSAS